MSVRGAVTPAPGSAAVRSTPIDWRRTLPALRGRGVTLRELRASDAPSLAALLSRADVARFISEPPTTVEGFEQFIAWTHRQRSAGSLFCLAITLRGSDTAIGLFQVRQLSNAFDTAEWGFALGSPYWGRGIFQESADLVLRFIFDTLGANRLEARATVQNGRGNAALMKLGAVHEGVLRNALRRHDGCHDQVLYSILAGDWRANRGRIVANASALVH